jgi:hypothetical protein
MLCAILSDFYFIIFFLAKKVQLMDEKCCVVGMMDARAVFDVNQSQGKLANNRFFFSKTS